MTNPTPAEIEAAALAVAKVKGFDYSGPCILDSENPRAREFVAIATAALTAAAAIRSEPAEIARLREALAAAILEHDAGGITLATSREMREALTAAAIRSEPAESEAMQTLAELSSSLGAGMGDEKTTAKQYDKRIRWGVEHQIGATITRCAAVVEELSKRPQTTWGEVKSAILALRSEPAESVEPVAWRMRLKGDRHWTMLTKHPTAHVNCEIHPLYAAPPPPAQDERA